LLGFVLGPLDILATQTVGLSQSLLEFLLDVQGHFQSQRANAFEDQRRECSIDYAAGNTLTQGQTVFYAPLLTKVVGAEATAALVVTQRHCPAAFAANDQALEQGRAFACRSTVPSNATGLQVVLQPLLVLLKLLPADITRMSVFNQDPPLLPRQVYTMPSALSIFPGSGSPETKRSRVTRIMQSIQGSAQSQPFPNQLAGARLSVSGEFEFLFSKGLHRSPCRAGPTKSLEKMP